MSKSIFLFDMDGTLTKPREKIERHVVKKIKQLSDYGDIGIVTGSDIDYIFQQCIDMFEIGGVHTDRVLLFPCNGTKKYKWAGSKFKKCYEADMVEDISQESFNYILQTILSYQLVICVQHNLPFTGTFFQYRGSMLNWCPIGRQAGSRERSDWVTLDNKNGIRKHFLNQLKEAIENKNYEVEVALGGSTSFDIFPKGWDKTYALTHLDEYEDIYFVGDKCQEDGNDKALYDLLHQDGNSFETNSPEKTIEIIDNLIKKII